MQMQQVASVRTVEITAQHEQGTADVSMDIDAPRVDDRGTKRSAEDGLVDRQKKAKTGLFVYLRRLLIRADGLWSRKKATST